MTAQAAEQYVAPRYNLGASTDTLNLIMPTGGRAIPDEVRATSDAALAAYDRYHVARREFFAAREELPRAAAVDRSADRAALAADTALPTHRAEVVAKAALVAAERKFKASEDAYVDLQYALAKLIHKHRTGWLLDQEDTDEALRIGLRDKLADIVAGYDQLTAERNILVGLRDFPEGGSLVGFSGFGRASGRQEQLAEQRRQQATEEIELAIKQGGSSSRLISPTDFNMLVACITRLIEGER
jgi:hypothetical protein